VKRNGSTGRFAPSLNSGTWNRQALPETALSFAEVRP
jgi:hypothetical protein